MYIAIRKLGKIFEGEISNETIFIRNWNLKPKCKDHNTSNDWIGMKCNSKWKCTLYTYWLAFLVWYSMWAISIDRPTNKQPHNKILRSASSTIKHKVIQNQNDVNLSTDIFIWIFKMRTRTYHHKISMFWWERRLHTVEASVQSGAYIKTKHYSCVRFM